MQRLDAIAVEKIGQSVVDVVYDPARSKADLFDETLFTHPAIFMFEYALAQLLIEEGIKPDFVLGSSLGELAAATVAEVISVDQCMHLVLQQAMTLQSRCMQAGMLVVLHNVNIFNDTPLFYNNSELAAVNYASSFVVSGSDRALKDIEQFLRDKGIIAQPLAVTRAFHSNLIAAAKPELDIYANSMQLKKPAVPFISCSHGHILSELEHNHWWKAIRNPIEMVKTVQYIERQGAFIYLDLGPSGTLVNLVKNNLRSNHQSLLFPVITPFGQDIKSIDKIIEFYKVQATHIRNNIDCQEKNMTAYLFPGQGSQQKGMGGDVFDEFSDHTAKADAILGYSIKSLCHENPNNDLSQTQFTQPALYVVNALSYLKKLQSQPVPPAYVAGHSLGEYNALFAAGVFDFETGLKLVQKRGQLMSQASGGSMAAVVGCDLESIQKIIQENVLSSIDIANFNSPTQIVIAGPKEDLIKAEQHFKAAGARFLLLNVSAPFHSRYMQTAMEEFSRFIESFNFAAPKIPVIANVDARPYQTQLIKHNLVEQIRKSVQWNDSIRYLLGKGIEDYEEIGPGKVLTSLIVKIQKEATPLIVTEVEASAVSENSFVTTNIDIAVGDIKSEQTLSEKTPASETSHSLTLDKNNQSPEAVKAPVIDIRTHKTLVPSTLPFNITADRLGSAEFLAAYNVKHAYVSGSMYKAIASKEIVVRMGKAGYIGFYGSGGMQLSVIEESIQYIQKHLNQGESYGMNLLSNVYDPNQEMAVVDLYLRYGIRCIEAAAYMQLSPALVKYRLKGLSRDTGGKIQIKHKLIAKVSRPEVAQVFLSPPAENILAKLLASNQITREQVELGKQIPMADDLCIEADSGGHTDMGVASTLLPTIIRLRDQVCLHNSHFPLVRVGAAGGIGTPEAALAMFMLGADFILTGSINQCTVEAGTSDDVKDMLQDINVHDTDYAPAGDMFELGARVQVLKRGVFFPARANKLYELWKNHNSLESIDEATRKQIQEKFFKRSFEAVYAETKEYYAKIAPEEITKAEKNPKHKMALVFRWYFVHTTRLAMRGVKEERVNYQVHCGPALGAFNQWVKNTELENWRNRHVDVIGEKLMESTAVLLNQRMNQFSGTVQI